MKFCGIGLQSNNSVLVITDETDKRLVTRRCPNDINTILTVLAPHKPQMAAVVVESTYNWYWLVDGLKTAGFEFRLANTVPMKRYAELKYSDDKEDAAHLAVRDLGRKRIQPVRARNQHELSVENIMARSFGSRESSNVIKRLSVEQVASKASRRSSLVHD